MKRAAWSGSWILLGFLLGCDAGSERAEDATSVTSVDAAAPDAQERADAGTQQDARPQEEADATVQTVQDARPQAADATVQDAQQRTDAAPPPVARDAAADAPFEAAALPDVDASSPLVGLADPALLKLCNWARSLLDNPSKEQICTLLSLQAASPAACRSDVATCVATRQIDTPAQAPCEVASVRGLPARCASVTVAQYEACATAAAAASNQRLAMISCDAPRATGADAGSGPPACASLNQTCPELAPRGSGADSAWSGGSFTCDDGWPLFRDEVCNGVADCSQAEDERGC